MFTAAEYAAKRGCKRQYVHKVLRNQPAGGEKIVRGVRTAAWSIGALPSPFVRDLAREASRHAFASPLEYMQSVAQRPKLPSLSAIVPDEITRAQKLQRALTASFALPIDRSVSELARIAADEYQREFGRAVSNRYLRKIIADVLQRDGGRREFGRLDLYIAKTPRKRVVRTSQLCAAFKFDELENAIATLRDRNQPTIAEIAYCWREVVPMILDRIAGGADERKLKRQLRDYIVRSASFMGPTPAAAKRNINLKLRAAIDGGGRDAITDGRLHPKRECRDHEAFRDDIRLLAQHTVFFCSGRESQAFRQLYEGTTHNGDRFSDAFRASTSFDVREAKSEVPKLIRAAVQPMVRAIAKRRLGPHAARLALPSIHRDWNDVAAGASYTSDDVTLNHYVIDWNDAGQFEFDGRRFNVCRPQFLPVVDERSSLPLGFSLIAARAYNSRHIRTLMTRICMRPEIGLPFEQFAFERGIWAARNVEALAGWPDLDESFSRFGVRLSIRHATTPKAKVIEQVIGALQNLDDFAPGYIGRDEQSVNYEREQKFLLQLKRVGQPRKGEVDPRELLMEMSECEEMLASVMQRFANEPQNGKRLEGLSPAEGWKQLSGHKWHVVLPESLRYLLGTEEATRTVTSEGIELRIGRAKKYYCGSDQLGALIGEKVRVRYNEELPEMVAVTHIASDPRGLCPFSVPLFKEVPAHGATSDQFAEAREHQNRFASYGRALYRELAPRSSNTLSSDNLGSEDLRAAGVAHNRVEREFIEVSNSGVEDRRAIRRLSEQHGLAIDPSKIRNTKRSRRSLEKLDGLEARILAAESTASQGTPL